MPGLSAEAVTNGFVDGKMGLYLGNTRDKRKVQINAVPRSENKTKREFVFGIQISPTK